MSDVSIKTASKDPEPMENNAAAADIEKGREAHLANRTVSSYSWSNVTVTVKNRQTKSPKQILSNASGLVNAGELLALMGPSGSGKTTLLNALAYREATSGSEVDKSLFVNGRNMPLQKFRKISSFVEQEDALLGALTVEETLSFSAKLALPSSVSKVERIARIESLMKAFGLRDQAKTLIGTPIRKGISGGQKRRVSVASQLITSPKILFLDEPTSGLDSAASYEVISFVRNIARENNLLIIASIHQPSTATFNLFDKLLLLSQGRTVYNGPVTDVNKYFTSLGYPIPMYTNPGEFIIDLVNTDFAQDRNKADERLIALQEQWTRSECAKRVADEIENEVSSTSRSGEAGMEQGGSVNPLRIPLTLTHRSLIKSYRDVIAYGIRIAMYMGLAILMGTVWLRLDTEQKNIQAFINAIFFGGAFMSFMAVAYIPSFLEDRSLFVKERANGLYGPTAFMVANFITGIPFLFVITIVFSVISYWLSNFRPSADGFWNWVMWLFLDLLAAESLVILISAVAPVFVISLAATAFANGLWMSVGGFMVAPKDLNVFWRYWAHYSDYQSYVFQGMMVNEFAHRTYGCGEGCRCMYPSELEGQCKIQGTAVLSAYGYATDKKGEWAGILVAIVFAYRLLGWLALYLRKT
ncbi:ABC transporter G family member 15 [Botryosphaeria dothidea]|uniref:ABC transporter G family member 15 n=1 Tax=Botryosphaeria dothidea TaxID=55169 RepID=A0A8H4NBF9_9PEZI|nr:ABC transporter G family member 15 [Botryosphaeria dothidea]